MSHRRVGIGATLLLLGCGAPSGGSRALPAPSAPETVLLVSIDGFRYDYLDRYASPNLHRFAAAGVRAPLVPVFPSKTFPNHYTIVTGLYPAHHGIVDNTIYDPVFDAVFRIGDSVAVGEARWWGGEPLWVTVQRQGRSAAAYYWPGSEAPIDGMRPRYWKHYDHAVPDSARVRQVLDWLTLAPPERPSFVTLYFSDVDGAGHRNGPDSPQVAAAVLHVDSAMGLLLDGLATRGLDDRVDVIVISDHGMSAISPDRAIALDDYVPAALVRRVVGGNPVVGIWPATGMVDSVYGLLHGRDPHLAVWRKAEIPARFHYQDNRRIAPIMALADVGWSIALQHRDLVEHPERYHGGTHGYDDTTAVMRALFLARGPAFRAGLVAPAFRNIHLYDLMAGILGVVPAPNDGNPDSTAALRR
jgi:predicted AlkP superfamily pyrophosphatase or phosphodiesterase